MQRFQNILVGVDVTSGERIADGELGGPTLEAVRRAVWLGQNLNATVTFFAALDISAHAEAILHDEFKEFTKSAEESAGQVLDRLVNEAGAAGVSARRSVCVGQPWLEITKQVIRGQHDLLLVGTRNRGAASRFFFGSTASKLVRNCPCPVWVTRPDPKFDDINMLVACDLGPLTERLLHIAVGGGRLMDARVHLLHCIEFGGSQNVWFAELPSARVTEYRNKARDEAGQKLREILSRTDHRTLPKGLQIHMADGDVDAAVLDAIDQHGIDLLVMGTQARHGLTGVLIGNTAERLLSQVKCSVLVVKPDGFVSPVRVD